jgi:hypothetical protein
MKVTWKVPPAPKGQRRYVDYFTAGKGGPGNGMIIEETHESEDD